MHGGFAKVYIIYNTSIAHYVKAAMLVVFQQKNLIMIHLINLAPTWPPFLLSQLDCLQSTCNISSN